MNLEKLFHLKENHTDVKTEIMAGITTFMTMAYILAVNPNLPDGTVIQLPVCPGTWYGTECILCIYRSSWHGLFLAAGSGCCICGRYHLYPAFPY